MTTHPELLDITDPLAWGLWNTNNPVTNVTPNYVPFKGSETSSQSAMFSVDMFKWRGASLTVEAKLASTAYASHVFIGFAPSDITVGSNSWLNTDTKGMYAWMFSFHTTAKIHAHAGGTGIYTSSLSNVGPYMGSHAANHTTWYTYKIDFSEVGGMMRIAVSVDGVSLGYTDVDLPTYDEGKIWIAGLSPQIRATIDLTTKPGVDRGNPRYYTPPLHQTRSDHLAPGGAWRASARTRQASIWQSAYL